MTEWTRLEDEFPEAGAFYQLYNELTDIYWTEYVEKDTSFGNGVWWKPMEEE